MCEVNSSQYVCLFLSISSGCVCVCVREHTVVYLHVTATVKRPVSIALGGWQLQSGCLTFCFPQRWDRAPQTPTNFSSAGCNPGNTLLLNLHFPECLSPTTKHPLLAPPGAQSQRNESLEKSWPRGSWAKMWYLSFYMCLFLELKQICVPYVQNVMSGSFILHIVTCFVSF